MKAARCKIRGLKSNLHSRKQVHGGRTAGLLEFVVPTILYETSPGRLERGCSAMVGGLLTGAVRCFETVRQGSADRLRVSSKPSGRRKRRGGGDDQTHFLESTKETLLWGRGCVSGPLSGDPSLDDPRVLA